MDATEHRAGSLCDNVDSKRSRSAAVINRNTLINQRSQEQTPLSTVKNKAVTVILLVLFLTMNIIHISLFRSWNINEIRNFTVQQPTIPITLAIVDYEKVSMECSISQNVSYYAEIKFNGLTEKFNITTARHLLQNSTDCRRVRSQYIDQLNQTLNVQ